MADGGTMQVLALQSFETLPSVVAVPTPEPGAGEVLVRVTAASVNPYDTFVAMGAMKEHMTYEFPAVLGTDVAGIVDSRRATATPCWWSARPAVSARSGCSWPPGAART